jgi:SnoaL-like protein
MPSENVEMVRTLLAPFEAIDTAEIEWRAPEMQDLLASSCSPEIEVLTLEWGRGLGLEPSYRGIDGLTEYLSAWTGPFTEYHVEWLEFIDAGDYVLLPTRQWGIGETSGARVELDLVWVLQLRDGLITRFLQYNTLDEAKAAIGAEAGAK